MDSRGRRSPPIAFAHRGARAERRENTLPAFARALELGATGLESDAWITADGVVVLDHDGTLRDPRQRRIRDATVAQLPPHIPTLESLYATCGSGFELSLDIKDPAAFRSVVEVAEAFGASPRLWSCYPDGPTLAKWGQSAGGSHLVHSTSIPMSSRFVGSGQRMMGGLLDLARTSGIDAVNMRARAWNQRIVDAVHRAGLLVFAWDAQRPRQIDRILGLDVDGVYCDRPQLVLGAIKGRYPISGAPNRLPASEPPDTGNGPNE